MRKALIFVREKTDGEETAAKDIAAALLKTNLLKYHSLLHYPQRK